MSDTNRIALVTGANSGIGFQISKQLLAAGLEVLVGARSTSKGVDACARLGTGARPVLVDVTNEASIAAVASEVRRLDVLVNNAGINPGGEDMSGTSMEQIRRAYETNVFGLVAVTQAFLPALRRSAHPPRRQYFERHRFAHLEHQRQPAVRLAAGQGRWHRLPLIEDGGQRDHLAHRPGAGGRRHTGQCPRPWTAADESHRGHDRRRRPRRGSGGGGPPRSAARRRSDRRPVVLGRDDRPLVIQIGLLVHVPS